MDKNKRCWNQSSVAFLVPVRGLVPDLKRSDVTVLSRKRVAIESTFPQLTDSESVVFPFSVKIVRKWKNLPSQLAESEKPNESTLDRELR